MFKITQTQSFYGIERVSIQGGRASGGAEDPMVQVCHIIKRQQQSACILITELVRQ